MPFYQDVRYGLRMLLKNPGFTLLAVGVLALGIGANSAIFNLVNSFLLRPLDVHEPDRLVGCYSKDTGQAGSFRAFSYPNYRDLRESGVGFSHLAAHNPSLAGLREGDNTRRIMVDLVSANYLSTFGVAPALGRDFQQSEEIPGANVQVAIVSQQLWKRNGGSPDFVGSTIEINGSIYTVIGIAPRGFTGTSALLSPDVWLPLGVEELMTSNFRTTQPRPLDARDNHRFILIGRLQGDLTLSQVNERLSVVASNLESAYPEVNENQELVAHPLSRISVSTAPRDDREMGALFALLAGMAGIVLLIASLNLANMQAARVSARTHEFAVRLALGSGRSRVVRQLLVEGLMLSFVGGSVALVLAYWAPSLLAASMMRIAPFNLVFNLVPDWRVMAATLGFCVLSSMVFTLGPVWKLFRSDFMGDLKEQRGSGLDGAAGRRLFSRRNLPVLAEIALSMVLLTAGGLFARGAFEAALLDPGFSIDDGIMAEVDPGLIGYEETESRLLYEDMVSRLRRLPGVRAASLAATIPFGNVSLGRTVLRAEDLAAGLEETAESVSSGYNIVGAQYFEALGIPLIYGRTFSLAEEQPSERPPVAVVDELLAKQLWPDGDVLGRRIAFNRNRPAGQPAQELEIVGVVSSVKSTLFDPDDDDARVYVPWSQAYVANMNLHIRLEPGLSSDPSGILGQVRDELKAVHPSLPILAIKTLAHHFDESIELWVVRTGAYVFSIFGLLAVFLAAIGVYGVRAYSVARRTHEIGIRLALGASLQQVGRLVLGEGLKLSVLGVSIGLLLSLATSRLLSLFLYRVSPTDPVVFGLAGLILCSVVLLACYVPARRASRVDPMVALRYE